jgi:quercetin dioxygenase-like cupin family protein
MPTLAPRRIYNPLQRDHVTFLETAAESGGARTRIEVELAPGGGVPLHRHETFAERFTVREGVLGLEVGGERLTLRAGESALAPRRVWHRFFDASGAPCRFEVELSPGSEGFERTLLVGYGLARDGRTFRRGIPRSLNALALLFVWSDTRRPWMPPPLAPLLRWIARRAAARGVDRALLEAYAPS